MPVRCRVGLNVSKITQNIEMGNSTIPLSAAYNQKALAIYTTSASTDASTSFEPVYISTILTGVGQVGGRVRVNLATEVACGSWINAFKASLDLGTTGSSAGLGSCGCFEITMHAGAGMPGAYCAVECEITCPTSWTGANKVSYFYLGSSGATKANFDTVGYLWYMNGLTGAAGKLLSANEQTLRVLTGPTTTRYVVLSQIENGLGLGTSALPMTLVASLPFVSCYNTCAATTGTIRHGYFQTIMTAAGTAQAVEGFRSDVEMNVKVGNVAAIYAYLDFKTNGYVNGATAGICSEIYFPGSTLIRGTYCAYTVEFGCPANFASNGNPIIAFAVDAYGTRKDQVDANGYLFSLAGLTSGATSMWYDNQKAAPAVEEFVRVKTPAGDRFLGLYNANA